MIPAAVPPPCLVSPLASGELRADGDAWLPLTVAYVVVVLVLFGGSLDSGLILLLAMLVTLLGSGLVVSLGADRMLLALPVCVVAFNGLYAPVLGLFLGLLGDAPVLYKIVLGLRSAAYAALLAWCVGALCMSKVSNPFFRLAFPGLILLLLVWVAVSPVGLEARSAYLFNSFLPFFMSLLVAAYLCTYRYAVVTPGAFRFVVTALVVLLLVGAIYFLLLPSFYHVFRPDLVASKSGGAGGIVMYGEYDGSWRTSIEGYRFNRMVGTFADPIVIGYLCAVMAFVSLVFSLPVSGAVFIVMLVCTLAKGAALFFIQSVCIYYIGRRNRAIRILCTIAFVVLQIGFAGLTNTSGRVHLQGLIGGVSSIVSAPIAQKILGFGLGQGGNLGSADFAAAATAAGGSWRTAWLGSGAESAIGVIAHQTGALGLLTLAAFSLALMLFRVRDEKTDRPYHAIVCLWSALLCNCFLQENCFNVSVTSSVLLGTVLLTCRRREAASRGSPAVGPIVASPGTA